MEKTIFCLDQVGRLQLEVTAKELVLQQVIFGPQDTASRDHVKKLRGELEGLYRQIIRVEVQGIYPSNYPLSMQVVDMISRCNRFMKQGSWVFYVRLMRWLVC